MEKAYVFCLNTFLSIACFCLYFLFVTTYGTFSGVFDYIYANLPRKGQIIFAIFAGIANVVLVNSFIDGRWTRLMSFSYIAFDILLINET